MTWNYRVIRYEQGGYGLHEVYYDEAGEPNGMTVTPVGFVADEDGGVAELTQSLETALRDAKERPILDERIFANKPGP